MEPLHLPTEEEVRAAVREGEEAVVYFVANLLLQRKVASEKV